MSKSCAIGNVESAYVDNTFSDNQLPPSTVVSSGYRNLSGASCDDPKTIPEELYRRLSIREAISELMKSFGSTDACQSQYIFENNDEIPSSNST